MYNVDMKTLCPVCHSPLSKKGNRAVCINGHSFDFAKEGYLNLLLANKKHSQDPGDNKEMVKARKDFLDEGFYTPLANKIASIINDRFNRPITLIDAGVGTGFYLSKIISSRNNEDDVYLAIDISKHAVRYASKLNSRAECSVQSVYDMPFEDKSSDVITCVFSPYSWQEYARCLKDDGVLIVANPAKNHLIELRNALYLNVKDIDSPLIPQGFVIVCSDEIEYKFEIDNISSLLMMTPYAYRASKESVERVKNISKMQMSAHFHIYTLKKSSIDK